MQSVYRNLGPVLLTLSLLCPPGFAIAQGTATRDADTHFFDANTGDLKAELGEAKAAGPKATAAHAPLAALCHALLNSSEFLYVE